MFLAGARGRRQTARVGQGGMDVKEWVAKEGGWVMTERLGLMGRASEREVEGTGGIKGERLRAAGEEGRGRGRGVER